MGLHANLWESPVFCISPAAAGWEGVPWQGQRATRGAASCQQALGLALSPSPSPALAPLPALGMSVLHFGFF